MASKLIFACSSSIVLVPDFVCNAHIAFIVNKQANFAWMQKVIAMNLKVAALAE